MKELNSGYIKLLLKLNKVKYGKNVKFYGFSLVRRYKNANIEIGNNCVFRSRFLSNPIGINHRCIIVAARKGNIKIGNNVGMSGSVVYSYESIEIGENTMIGSNCHIIDTDFHPVNPDDRLNNRHIKAKNAPIKIGKNVFIGCNSIILKGTIIGDNCVVGAGAVVSGVFEANSIIAGNPAIIVRRNINE